MAEPLLHPDILRALVAVAETGGFTHAARSLGLQQSTVSQQIRKLEDETGRRLFDRDTHTVTITPAGEALLHHARRILGANEEMHRHLRDVALRGRLRFGASEDFVLSALPDVIAAFLRRHPEIDLEVTSALSETLYKGHEAGSLDVLLAKRSTADRRGTTVWRENAVWIGRPDLVPNPDDPVPLLLYPQPSVTRAMAIESMEKAGRSWRLAFTSGSLSALSAAALAGVGIIPHSARLIPPGLGVLANKGNLPELGELDFVVVGPGGHHPVSEALIAAILQWSASGRTHLRPPSLG